MTSFNEDGKESEADKPKKSPCKRGRFVVIILAVLIIGAICCHIHHFHHSRPRSIDPELDKFCTVQLRRDALGGSGLVSPLTDNQNGTDVALRGRLVAIDREAILLNHVDEQSRTWQLWIPKSSILLIKYEPD